MNQTLKIILTVAAFTAVASGLPAQQPALKIVTVDMAKIYDSHYTTQEKMAQLGESERKAQENLEAMNKERAKLAEDYKKSLEQSQNTLLTAEARASAQEEAQKKLQEIQGKQNEMQQFYQNTRVVLQQQRTNFQGLMLEEISKKVVEVAKRRDATLVIDRSGPSLLGVAPVIYADPAYDITEEVMAEINKDKPAAATAPAAPAPGGPKAAPSPPAAEPAITLPDATTK